MMAVIQLDNTVLLSLGEKKKRLEVGAVSFQPWSTGSVVD